MAVIALVVIGAVALGFYAYYGKGESAGKAREGIEATRVRARDERQRWEERLGELKAQVEAAIDKTVEGAEETTGARQRLDELKDRLKRCEEEFGPVYREKLRGWRVSAEEGLDSVKDKSGEARDRLKALWKEIHENIADSEEADDHSP